MSTAQNFVDEKYVSQVREDKVDWIKCSCSIQANGGPNHDVMRDRLKDEDLKFNRNYRFRPCSGMSFEDLVEPAGYAIEVDGEKDLVVFVYGHQIRYRKDGDEVADGKYLDNFIDDLKNRDSKRDPGATYCTRTTECLMQTFADNSKFMRHWGEHKVGLDMKMVTILCVHCYIKWQKKSGGKKFRGAFNDIEGAERHLKEMHKVTKKKFNEHGDEEPKGKKRKVQGPARNSSQAKRLTRSRK